MRIKIVRLRRLGKAVHHRTGISPPGGAAEQPVLPPYHEGTNRILGDIVIRGHLGIFQIPDHPRVMIPGVMNRFTQCCARRHQRGGILQPFPKRFPIHLGPFPAQAGRLIRADSFLPQANPKLPLHLVDLFEEIQRCFRQTGCVRRMGIHEFSAHMGQASDMRQFVRLYRAIVGRITVGLQNALEPLKQLQGDLPGPGARIVIEDNLTLLPCEHEETHTHM